MGSSERPLVSVVIASVNGPPYPFACLDALREQDGGLTHEVIVADRTGPDTARTIRERYPEARVLECEPTASVPELRSAGVREARGEYVAVTEDHCVPRRTWLASLVGAQRRTGWAAVGGGVENDASERLVDWAAFFCEYHGHMSPVPDGPAEAVPGMNVVYHLPTIDGLRDALTAGEWESFVHDRLRAAGLQIGLASDVVIGHDKRFTVAGFAWERFHLSRAYAGYRLRGAGLGRRTAWTAGAAMVLPLLLVARVGAVAARRRQLARFARALPLVVCFSFVWAAGEAVGYLTGPGRSMERIR